MMLTLHEAQAMLPRSQLVGDGALAFTRVHSDTRSIEAGDLFVALRGERFDAHDFLPAARAAGAVAALAEHGLAQAGLAGLLVDDSLLALQTLAAAWRRRAELPLIAVAGSNGKTTVTQMIASMLRDAYGGAAFATEGNLNNHIGVPLTLLRLRPEGAQRHRAGVIELGMNHAGEIKVLAQMAAPTVALVTNAQREHQEFMATVEAAARENGAVFEALADSGVAVFPADDACAPLWRQQAGSRRQLRFALQAPAEVHAEVQWHAGHWQMTLHTPLGGATLALRLAGLHNVRNALAATAAALAAGLPLHNVVHGLENFEAVKGRSQLHRLHWRGQALALVDDSYNANPDSVRAAIDVLASLDGPRWLVLGDMGEVGDSGPAYHAEVGAYARERGIDSLWAVGQASADSAAAFGAGARHFDDVDAAIAALDSAPAIASALVKGSRFMRMERVLRALQTLAGKADHAA